jgi:hypothetical protein
MSTGIFIDQPIRTPRESRRIAPAMQLDRRLLERSVLDAFISSAQRQPEHAANTMPMAGAPDEQPRRVNCAQLLGTMRRPSNLFHSVGGARPGVACATWRPPRDQPAPRRVRMDNAYVVELNLLWGSRRRRCAYVGHRQATEAGGAPHDPLGHR